MGPSSTSAGAAARAASSHLRRLRREQHVVELLAFGHPERDPRANRPPRALPHHEQSDRIDPGVDLRVGRDRGDVVATLRERGSEHTTNAPASHDEKAGRAVSAVGVREKRLHAT
jgi:hypothetical protein